jgi:hypothetical protein
MGISSTNITKLKSLNFPFSQPKQYHYCQLVKKTARSNLAELALKMDLRKSLMLPLAISFDSSGRASALNPGGSPEYLHKFLYVVETKFLNILKSLRRRYASHTYEDLT